MKKEIVLGQDVDEPVVDGVGHDDNAEVIDVKATDNNKLPKGAILNNDGTVTWPLRSPVTIKIRDESGRVRDEVYDELRFRPLKGADLRKVRKASDDDANVVAFACATDISKPVMDVLFDKMEASDVVSGAQIMSVFMNGGR